MNLLELRDVVDFPGLRAFPGLLKFRIALGVGDVLVVSPIGMEPPAEFVDQIVIMIFSAFARADVGQFLVACKFHGWFPFTGWGSSSRGWRGLCRKPWLKRSIREVRSIPRRNSEKKFRMRLRESREALVKLPTPNRWNHQFRIFWRPSRVAAMKNPPFSPVSEFSPENMICNGILKIPRGARSIIVFVHGPGNSCLSPRNRLVAQALVRTGFAVLLPELADHEDGAVANHPQQDSHYVDLVATRLAAILDWLGSQPRTKKLRIGLFGVRDGADAAMIAAVKHPDKVRAVISRGGHLNHCDGFLEQVTAPTLMIVGGRDDAHIGSNRRACGKIKRKPMLEIVQGSSDLFPEPGMMEKVASMSCLWFSHILVTRG